MLKGQGMAEGICIKWLQSWTFPGLSLQIKITNLNLIESIINKYGKDKFSKPENLFSPPIFKKKYNNPKISFTSQQNIAYMVSIWSKFHAENDARPRGTPKQKPTPMRTCARAEKGYAQWSQWNFQSESVKIALVARDVLIKLGLNLANMFKKLTKHFKLYQGK